MNIDRRVLLAIVPGLLAYSALADEPLAALSDYERDSGGRVGLYAENLATGSKLAWRADERFVMCSTFKASLVASVLQRVDSGKSDLSRMIPYTEAELCEYAPVAKKNLDKGAMSVADMCQAAVELSDNTCANKLLEVIGGPQAMTQFWRSIGDTSSRLDHNEPVLNWPPSGNPEDTTTPAAMSGNMRSLVLGDVLQPSSRERLTGWMLNCQTGAKRLRAGLPPSWRVGDKTGNNLKDAAGDIAVIWPKADQPIVVAAYTQGGTPTTDQIDAVFKAIGQRVANL
jgi:beta-lactamase class A